MRNKEDYWQLLDILVCNSMAKIHIIIVLMKLIVDIIYSERIQTYLILTKWVKADIGNGTSI